MTDNAIELLAKALGLRVRVTSDPVHRETCVDACLARTQRATYTFDEEIYALKAEHSDDYFKRAMLDLQARVLDETAKHLSEIDGRGRVYRLEKADRDTAYEMLRDAIDHLHSRYVYAEDHQTQVDEKRRRYEALMKRLLK